MITYPAQYTHVVHAAERMALNGLRAGITLEQVLSMARQNWRLPERQVAETVIRSIYADNGGRQS